ncbi:MAG: hypothetical protein ACQR33_04315 [Candidatus Saccharibacteria bacterium]
MYVTEGGATTSLEFCKINPEAARDIDDILANPEEVYASFLASQDVDLDTIDPLDLQAHTIAKLQLQRRTLLEELNLLDVADSMRAPRLYFEAITSSFFDQCGSDRLLWSRARITGSLVGETAHTGTFRSDHFGVIEPQIRGSITHVTPREEYEARSHNGASTRRYYELVTDLQSTRPDTRYRFYTSDASTHSDASGLIIEELAQSGNEAPICTPITDTFDRFTLLQALTVDLHTSLGEIQHESDARARHALSVEVYGIRSTR